MARDWDTNLHKQTDCEGFASKLSPLDEARVHGLLPTTGVKQKNVLQLSSKGLKHGCEVFQALLS